MIYVGSCGRNHQQEVAATIPLHMMSIIFWLLVLAKVPVDKKVSFTVKTDEKDPSKKPPVQLKRGYNKIEDWKEGCPRISSMSLIDAKANQTGWISN